MISAPVLSLTIKGGQEIYLNSLYFNKKVSEYEVHAQLLGGKGSFCTKSDCGNVEPESKVVMSCVSAKQSLIQS